MANQNTRIEGQGIQTLAAGSAVTVSSKNRDSDRRQFVVSNLDPAGGNTIYVCGTNRNEALPVFPSQTVTLETDAEFVIKNPSGSSVNYVVGELYGRFFGGSASGTGANSGFSSGSSGSSGSGGAGGLDGGEFNPRGGGIGRFAP